MVQSIVPYYEKSPLRAFSPQNLSREIRGCVWASSHFLYSIWLFTYSDLKTIIATSIGFGLFTALGVEAFGISPGPSFTLIVQRLPIVFLWAWLNLLPFTIENQRQPEAIMEDSINKPWRTMPSKRMEPEQAKLTMYVFNILAIYTSSRIGALSQCIVLLLIGYWYNHAKGADSSCIVRNLINGAGFICYTSGALQLELSPLEWQTFINPENGGLQWLGTIGAIVFTTVQLQDFYDQAGDAARNRKTLPLVIGDKFARYITAASMVTWGVLSPWYWGWLREGKDGGVLHGVGLCLATLACIIAARILIFRSVQADKKSFLLWNLWLVSQYALPFCAIFE